MCIIFAGTAVACTEDANPDRCIVLLPFLAGLDPVLCVDVGLLLGSVTGVGAWGPPRNKRSKARVLKSSSIPKEQLPILPPVSVSPGPHRLPLESHRGWNEAKTSPVKRVALISLSCLGLWTAVLVLQQFSEGVGFLEAQP